MEQSKACSRCKQILPFEAFYKRKASKDGMMSRCISCDKEYKANRTSEQKQADIERATRWAKKNPDKVTLNKKTSATKLRSIRNERNRQRYPEIRERLVEQRKARRLKDKTKFDRHSFNRRALKRGSGTLLSAKEISSIRNKPCFYCGSSATLSELDHVVPLIRGGKHSIGNIVPACSFCNKSKGAKLVMEWRLNKPRADSLRRADPRSL